MPWQEHVGDWINPVWPAGPGIPGAAGTPDTLIAKPSGTFAFRILLQTTVVAEQAAGTCKCVSDNASATTGYEGATAQRWISGETSEYAVAGALAKALTVTAAGAAEVAPVQVYGFWDDAPCTSDVAANDILIGDAAGTDAWDDLATAAAGKALALEAYSSVTDTADIFILI